MKDLNMTGHKPGIRLLLVVLALVSPCHPVHAEPHKPNVLFIMSDDLEQPYTNLLHVSCSSRNYNRQAKTV